MSIRFDFFYTGNSSDSSSRRPWKDTTNDSRIANFDKQYLLSCRRAPTSTPNLLINTKEEEEEERQEGKKRRKRICNVSCNSKKKRETRKKEEEKVITYIYCRNNIQSLINFHKLLRICIYSFTMLIIIVVRCAINRAWSVNRKKTYFTR